jgi:hypothetical protein
MAGIPAFESFTGLPEVSGVDGPGLKAVSISEGISTG